MASGDRDADAENGARLAPDALDRLRRQGGEELLRALLASFLARTPERLAEAFEALEDGRLEDAGRAFHSLKSSAGLVGALYIQREARAAEEAADEERSDDVLRATKRVEAAFERLLPELRDATGDAAPALPRVALVEDNEDNRILVRVLLGERYVIQEYTDGVSALAGIRAAPPDVVLLDVSLPGMDGLEVLRELRATDALAGLPIIAITAHAMRGDRENLIAAGFDDYVSKPILEERALQEPLERALARREQP